MADRIKGYVVTLKKDLKGEDAKRVRDAIRMLEPVLSVEEVESDGINDHMAEMRVKSELVTKLWDVLK